MKRNSMAFMVFIVLFAVQTFAVPQAKYVIFLIGDGMGLSHRTIAEYYLNAQKNNRPDVQMLRMNKFPIQGLSYTHSATNYITDSASAGTALASGYKTYEGAIGLDEQKKPLKSIARLAEEKNMKVGILTSVSIDHATPAVFYAYSEGRYGYYEIARQFPISGFDFFGAGSVMGEKEAQKKGLPSIVQMARDAGYKEVRTRKELQKISKNDRIWAYNHTVDKDASLFFEIDRPADHISLSEFTSAALKYLKNPKGFFLMVEGGRIDWAAHANDAKTLIDEVLAFDKAVEEAYKFYQENPADTIVIVTADHETGGLGLGYTDTGYNLYLEKLSRQTISGEKFSHLVQDWVREQVSFEEALRRSREYFDLDDLSVKEELMLRRGYKHSVMPNEERKSKGINSLYGGREPFMKACLIVSNRRAGISWTTIHHSASPVPVSAIGVGQELFGGYYDNTAIPKKLLQLMQ